MDKQFPIYIWERVRVLAVLCWPLEVFISAFLLPELVPSDSMCYNFAKFTLRNKSLLEVESMLSLNAVAKKIVSCYPKNQYLPEENILFRYLYDAYCKLERPDDSFEAVVADAKLASDSSSEKYVAARKTLVRWYADRYRPHDKKKAGQEFEEQEPTDLNTSKKKKTNQGIAREVFRRNIEEGIYRFDEPVDPKLFEVYLNDFPINQHPFQTTDARSFILHTAVAFLLSPDQLNRVLVTFGFHPLHVRHIHDMAIYVILQDATQNWTLGERRERDPFQEVWKVYEDARLLLIQAQTAEPRELLEGEQAAFQSDSTREVQQYILGQKLSRENLLAFVGSHTEFYNLRYRRLLVEHKWLVDLFSTLYIHGGSWEESDKKYNLYAFLSSNCREFNKKDFNRRIYGEIVKYQKHPKRELMIILWIYAYCFLFCPEVSTPCDFSEVIPFKHMKRKLGIPLEDLEYPFLDYFDRKLEHLRVLEYLSDVSDRASPLNGFYDGMTVYRIFSGSELVAFINKKLTDYTWCQLDGRNAFDYIILNLSPLKITMSEGGDFQSAFYGDEPIDNVRRMNVDNVPSPLVMIFNLLQEIKRLISDPGNIRMPLPCNQFYELI